MNDLVQEAERLELEREMMWMARQSFLAIWERYGSPRDLIAIDRLEKYGNPSTQHVQVLKCGVKLGWHKEAA